MVVRTQFIKLTPPPSHKCLRHPGAVILKLCSVQVMMWGVHCNKDEVHPLAPQSTDEDDGFENES